MVGLGEIRFAANGLGHLLMFGKLLAVVESERVYLILEAVQQGGNAAGDDLCTLVRHGECEA